ALGSAVYLQHLIYLLLLKSQSAHRRKALSHSRCLRAAFQECDEVEAAPSRRFLGTHLHPDNIPASFNEMKTKILVIFRNPKDTLVSFYHFSNNNPVLPSESWDSFYSNFMSGDVAWGSYFDHALAWEKRMIDPNVMIVTYEELKQDLSDGIRQISSFFGYTLTEAQVLQISDGSTFSAMKQSSANSHESLGDVIFRKGALHAVSSSVIMKQQ
ncbi:hypothetical protein KUCAC02_035619, partial [Chaenocephalus aceratus]